MYRGNIPLLRVLIVDDEPFIRQGLEVLIDWEAEGFIITGQASNGQAAIKLLKDNAYDMIITDIKMPEMDGVELVTRIKQEGLSDASIIILSGYYDFEYAKTAISCGCRDYILKPIQKDELLETLRKIMSEYSRNKRIEETKIENETDYLERHLAAIIWGKADCANLDYIRDKMSLSGGLFYIHFEISLNDKKFYILPEEGRREVQKKLGEYAKLMMKNYGQHIISNVMNHTLCYDMGIIFCRQMLTDKETTKEAWMKRVLEELSERVGYEIVACIGSEVDDICQITESFRDAVMLRSLRFYKTGSRESGDLYIQMSAQNSQFKMTLDQLIHAIEINDGIRIKKYGRVLYDMLYANLMEDGMNTEAVGSNMQYLIYRLLGLAYSHDAEINQENIMQYIREAVFSTESDHGSQLKFLVFLQEYSDYLSQLKKKTVQGSIAEIIEDMHTNYRENLSLKMFGEKYYINSAYLGQVFKKQYGCSFKTYLNNIRIRKAAESILNTDKLIYEISEEVGYKNREYFVGKFEEMYGMTPTRFRKRWDKDKMKK